MKRKLHKILGVSLTLVLMVSLSFGLVAAPAGADDLEWSKMSFPKAGSDGDWFRDADIDGVGPFAQAIDGTLYAFVDGENTLMKSDDSGLTWSETDYEDLTGEGDIVAMAVSTEDADILWAADTSKVYESVDAGDTWATLTTSTDEGGDLQAITSLAAGYVSDQRYLFIAAQDDDADLEDVYVLTPAYGAIWAGMSTGADDVYHIAASPNFNEEADPLLLAVVDDGDDAGDSVYVSYKFGGGAWDGGDGPAELYELNTTVNPPDYADITFPDNFDNSDNLEYFVAIHDGTPVADDHGGIYWVISDTVLESKVAASVDYISVDMRGDISDAYLVAGSHDGTVIYSDDYGDSWSASKKHPSNDGNVYVLTPDDFMDTEIAWAGTTDDGAAFSVSNGDIGKTWNQVSLIKADKDDLVGVAASDDAAIKYMITYDATSGRDSLWKNDGSWQRVMFADLADMDSVQLSPEFADDETLFVVDFSTSEIWRSTDGGDRFINQTTDPPSVPTAWIVIDDTTIITGDADGQTNKTTNNGVTWGSDKGAGDDDIVSFALSPNFNSDDTILLGDDTGDAYKSTNAGGKWSLQDTGDDDEFDDGPVYVAFSQDYADSELWYVAAEEDGSNDFLIARYDPDDGFETIYDGEDGTVNATGIVTSADGALYATNNADAGMWRSINPTASASKVVFEAVTEDFTSTEDGDGLAITNGNTLWAWDLGAANVWEYTDTLTGSPTLTSPSDNSSSGRTDSATITWAEVTGADEYQIKVNTTEDFDGEAVTVSNSEVTSVRIQDLEDGQTYYWKVRVASGEPTLSAYSSVWSFTTAFGAAQWNPFDGGVAESPNGSTDVQLEPSFVWNSADWATNYEFVLADNANFDNPIASETLVASVYSWAEA